MTYPLKPAAVTADRQTRQMRIEWSDGHPSLYPFSLLRNACPCAECRGGHDNMRTEPPPEVFRLPLIDTLQTRMRSVEPVGSYGLTIEWEDGHHYGIYNWNYLRKLCPCPVCLAETIDEPG
jgi:DUF971 family protein